MKFSRYAAYLQDFEAISSRLEITAKLAELFAQLDHEEVPQACYLMQGQLMPAYHNLEMQLATKTVMKALATLLAQTENGNTEDLFGGQNIEASLDEVEKRNQSLGDLGQTTMEVMGKYRRHIQKHQPSTKLTEPSIAKVYDQMIAIAKDSGTQSQQRKLQQFVDLLAGVDELSAKFIVRITLGRLRLGFSDMTMIDALSWAKTGGKSERDVLELAYQKKADIGLLAQTYLATTNDQDRAAALNHYQVKVGIPVIPALCQRLNSAAEMIAKMGEVFAEPKYDGLRVQMHINVTHPDKPQIHTFTRNLEENSATFPELNKAVAELHCKTCILDAEAIGYDPETGDLLPFQQTIQRKRKHEIDEISQQIPIRFYVFDILELDGEELISLPLEVRKEKMKSLFIDSTTFYHSQFFRTSDADKLHAYHEEQLEAGLEGVVVKQVSAPYQSGRKGWSWVKMKEAEGTRGKLPDTIDAVVMGYYSGRGKRAQFGIGAFLVGVYDAATQKVLTIAKIGTGITEQDLQHLKRTCDLLSVPKAPAQYQVQKMLEPDVWCRPDLVVEIAADEITNSPQHTAELALRFPRLVHFRTDKNWEQATSLTELQQMAEMQNGKA